MTTDLATVRANLIAMRLNHIGNHAVTARLSTLIEQLENYDKGTGDKAMLDKLIEQSAVEIEDLVHRTTEGAKAPIGHPAVEDASPGKGSAR